MALDKKPFSAPVLPTGLHLEGTATTNQGDCKFGPFAGSQCLSICVCYLASSYYNNETPVTSKTQLDEVLENGSHVDRILRNEGYIPKDRFAQLSDIPVALFTHQWACSIQTSTELFGLLMQESAADAHFILSLKKLLERNYFDITQYVLYICNGKSGAIVIKNNTFYIFDPHCISGHSGSPAAVLSSGTASAIINYIGPPHSEYTACHLYFIPVEYNGQPVKAFLLSNYGVQSYMKRKGQTIDLKAMAVVQQPTRGLAALPSCPSVSKDKFNFSIAPNGVFNFTGAHKQLPGSEQLVDILTNASKRKRTAASPTHSQSSGAHVSKKSTPTKNKKGASPEDKFETFWLDDNTLSSSAEDDEELFSDPRLSDDPFLTSSDIERNSAESPLDVSEYTSSVNSNHDYYRLDFSEHEDLQAKLLRLESQIEDLNKHTHVHGFPTIVDAQTKRPYKEAVALHLIDKLITDVVIEQGLVSSGQHQHQALNILRFLIIWSEKLSVPTDQLHALLKTGLQIPKLYQALSKGKFDSGSLKDLLTAKLNACLKKIHNNTADETQGLMRTISTSIKNSQFFNESKTAKEELAQILDASAGNYLVLTEEEAQELYRLTQELKTKLSVKNTEIAQEDETFERVLNSMNSFLPISEDAGPMEYNLPQKAQRLKELASTLTNTLTREANDIGQSMLQSMKEKDTLTLDIPDFHSLLNKILITLENAQVCVSRLKFKEDTLLESLQQLLYLGSEISAITSSKWNFQTPPAIAPVNVLTEIQTLSKDLKEQDKNSEALENILTDIENMLSVSQADASQNKFQKLALSLPILESYLANAGALVGPQGNKKFNKLTKEIQTIYKLKNVFLALIANITLNSLVNSVQQIVGFLKNHKLVQESGVQEALNGKLQELFTEVGGLIKKKKLATLDSSKLAALESLAGFSEEKSHSTIALFYTKITEALWHTKSSQELKAKSKELKSELAAANINNSHKRGLYKIITCAFKDLKETLTPSPDTSPPADHKAAKTSSKKINNKDNSHHLKYKDRDYEGDDDEQESLLSSSRLSVVSKKQGVTKPAKKQTPKKGQINSQSTANLIEDFTDTRAPSDVLNNSNPPLQQYDEESMDTSVPEGAPVNTSPPQETVRAEDSETTMEVDTTPTVPWNSDTADLKATQGTETSKRGSASKALGHHEQETSIQTRRETAVKGIIQEEIEKASEQAWKKIQNSFKNLDFASITVTDWEHVASEYSKKESKIIEALGPTLQKMMTAILEKLKEMVINATLALTPFMAPFQWPVIDWLTPYQANVIFYLKSISYPTISELAMQSEIEVQVLNQVKHSKNLIEATAGTYLDQDGHNLTQIISSIEGAASEYKLNVTTEVNNWIHDLKHNSELTHMPPKPDIIIPKKLLDPKLEQLAAGLRPKFKQCAANAEESLMADIVNEFQLLRHAVADAETEFNRSQEDVLAELKQILEEFKVTAPTSVSLKPVPDEDPVSFLSSLIRDGDLMNKLPYRETQEILKWAESACTRVMVKAPVSMKPKVDNLFSDIKRVKASNEDLLRLEESANCTDELDVLKKAVSTLDAKRIEGGQSTMQQWTKKITELEKLLARAELETTMRESISSLTTLATSAQTQSALASLKHKAAAIQTKWFKERQLSEDETITDKIEELNLYILYKLKFIDYYENQQSFVFNSFPLLNSATAQNDDKHVPHIKNTINLRSRLSALFSLRSSTAPKAWIETYPRVDSLATDYIPLKNGPPLSLQVTFTNFLETYCVLRSELTALHHNAPKALPGTLQAYHGMLITKLVESQWSVISQHAKDALQAYTSISGSISQDLKKNEFMAMVLTIHGLLLALKNTNAQYGPHETAILLPFKKILEINFWIWPGIVYYFLRMSSFQEGVSFLQHVHARCIQELSKCFLHQFVNSVDPPTGVPEPSAFLFCPKFWKPVQLEEYIWKQKEFVRFCDNSEAKARACFLAWVLNSINGVVVNQLWSSLKPTFLKGIETPNNMLSLLADAAYKRPKHFELEEASKSDEYAPFQYGLFGDTVIRVTQPLLNTQSGQHVPVTAFEIALAAIVRKFNPTMYLTSKDSLLQHETLEDIFLVSPLLDCSGYTDPFASFLKAPISPVSESKDGSEACTQLEKVIFASQKSWLQSFVQDPSQQSHLEFPIVLVDCENKVLGAYDFNEELVKLFPNISFQYDSQGISQWPLDLLSLSSLDSMRLTESNQHEKWIEEIAKQYSTYNLESFFTTYPLELHKREISPKDSETEGVSPPSSQPSPNTQTQSASATFSPGASASSNSKFNYSSGQSLSRIRGNKGKQNFPTKSREVLFSPERNSQVAELPKDPQDSHAYKPLPQKLQAHLPINLSQSPKINQAGNLELKQASGLKLKHNYIVPPLSTPVLLRPQSSNQQVHVGQFKVLATPSIFIPQPNKLQTTNSIKQWLTAPRELKSKTFLLQGPSHVQQPKKVAPRLTKFKIIQENVPELTQVPFLPLGWEFGKLKASTKLPRDLPSTQVIRIVREHQKKQKGTLPQKAIPLDHVTIPIFPTIKNNYLTIEEIIKNQALLLSPRESIIPIEQNLEPQPMFQLFIAETNIQEATKILIKFIEQIKQKLWDSTKYLVHSINKIKSLYL
ncbi:large tegument protein [Bovine gammaherpesvirus 6]|uniref:Large tegument protein n=1 Tax=Bovine gammaherpesvirus 6 TaxID=1504288 RepID=A0A060D349_9GAMA|nr:large tegument protein [Bovine gammaherpesvirus 6]AIB03219.1 large tegument protein [Bovine gammaherpesvirus 6]